VVPKRFQFIVSDTIYFRLTHEDVVDENKIIRVADIHYHDKHTWSEARFLGTVTVWNGLLLIIGQNAWECFYPNE
jgi:hypothetical protein